MKTMTVYDAAGNTFAVPGIAGVTKEHDAFF